MGTLDTLNTSKGTRMNWPRGEAAFVTGAASGIGLGVARALVNAGARVALADIDEQRLQEAAKDLAAAGGVVTTVRLDVSDQANWVAAADEAEVALGPISILCNIAGVNGGTTIDETPFEVWRWVQGINSDAQFLAAATFLPRFKSRGTRAHILNTSSMSGLVPMAHVGAYTASKFAAVGFTSVLREELRGTDIGVSLLLPGTVATRMSYNSGEAAAKLLGQEPNPDAMEANHALLANGADPDRVGEQVVEAMQQRQFVIVTHREWADLVRRQHAEIEAAIDAFDGRHGPDQTAQMLISGAIPASV